jgi:hypothetical protein
VTRTTIQRVLWIAALLLLPIPFYLGEPEQAPVLRLVFLTGLLCAVMLAEGGGTLAVLVGLGVLQALLWGGALSLLAALMARTLERVHAPALRTAVVAAIALGLVAASLTELYDTPLSSTRPRSSLLQIFE